jgi:integrase
MASLATRKLKDGKTAYRVCWNNGTAAIWLGSIPKRNAEAIKIRVEHLIAASISDTPITPDTAQWLNNIADSLRDKVAKAGLCAPRAKAEEPADDMPLLAAFVDAYIAGRPNLKPSTLTGMKQARKALVEHFAESRDIRTITAGDAEDVQSGLLGRGLALNTVRRLMGRSKQFFAYAVRKEIIAKNPFQADSIRCRVTENRDRDVFVTREMIEKIIEHCPNNQWKVLLSLARWGGMRTPSEPLALRWQDILWDQNKIVVQVPKLAHIPGKETRIIPLFPEILPHLRAVFEEAAEGEEFVITRYRGPKTNLRTQLNKIVKRAGIKPFAKPLQNMRASRATELAAVYPLHVVCEWIGNGISVAQKHYLSVLESDFEKAIAEPQAVTSSVTPEPLKA